MSKYISVQVEVHTYLNASDTTEYLYMYKNYFSINKTLIDKKNKKVLDSPLFPKSLHFIDQNKIPVNYICETLLKNSMPNYIVQLSDCTRYHVIYRK